MKDVVHGVVSVPSTKNEHRILIHYGRMAEAIQGLDSFALDFLPFVFLILYATLKEVTESLLAIVSTIHI